ncbi:MAG: SMP-30/gluconolactonase/LRE family protein [Acidimicrobiia bacterium]
MRWAVIRLVVAISALTCGVLPAVPAGSGPAGTGEPVPGVTAPGYDVRYLAEPNPLSITDGLSLDGKGGLYICLALTNGIVRMDLATHELTVIAGEFDAEPLVPDDITVGLDNAVVHPDGEIWVTNFNRGGLRRVNVATGTLDPVLPDRPLTLPFSLSEAPDGSILVGDFTSVNRVRDGQSTRLSRLLNPDNLQLLSPGAVQIGSDVYLSDVLPPRGRIFRLDTRTGKREPVASGFGIPWTVREGAGGRLLVADQALGAVFEVDPGTGSKTPVVTGLVSPSGLAYDPARGVVYVSDTGGGRVLAVDLASRLAVVVASGLDGPEGVAVDRDGTLLVVEGAAGRLMRVDPASGARTEVASGLPTKTTGFGLPLMNYSSDVIVRADGGIVVSGPADASLIELRRR